MRRQNEKNEKTKFQMLVVQQQKLHQLQLKIKYLVLVVQLTKQIITKKLLKLKRNLFIIITTSILLLQSLTLAASVFNARLAEANLITKTDFDAKLWSLNRKITSIKSKHLLVENELKKLKTFDSSYFIGKSHFEEDGTQDGFQYFNQCMDILKGLQLLVLAIIFIF